MTTIGGAAILVSVTANAFIGGATSASSGIKKAPPLTDGAILKTDEQ